MTDVEIDDDAVLMAEFVRTRDRRLFDGLFRRYRSRMLAFARRFVGSQALAEELAQEIFVRVYTTKQYQAETKFKTWLYRVATNVCLNEIRRSEHRQSVTTLDDNESQREEGAGPEADLLGAELRCRIVAVIDTLPAKQRAALLMVRQDGFSHDEVAEVLSVSVSAVKSLVHRALETLRLEVERYSFREPNEALASRSIAT